MDCARTSAADPAARGPEEVRAQPSRVQDADRRLEEWVASRLDAEASRSGRDLLGRTAPPGSTVGGLRRRPTPTDLPSAQAPGWKRLRIALRGEIVVARILDRQLLHEVPLAELRAELHELVRAGCSRIVLDLSCVEHVSSQFLEIVTTLERRCAARPGGHLKLCKVGPEVVRLLDLCGLDRHVEVAPDVSTALAGPWPEGPDHLAIAVLSGLLGRSDAGPTAAEALGLGAESSLRTAPSPGGGYVTIRRDGVVLGTIRIPESGLRIGRDAPCELRLGNRSVSRTHAWIGPRDGDCVLEDLGSSNGTIADGRRLRSGAIRLRDGASFTIGPFLFEYAATASPGPPTSAAEPSGIAEFADDGPDGSGEAPSEIVPLEDSIQAHRCFRQELIEGVLVLSPTVARLDDEETLDRMRACLEALAARPDPARKVVLNLAPVVSLPGRAIGLILAHLFRLQRLGGSLRLAQATPTVLVALEIVGLPALIETFPTLEDAVLSRWPS